MGNIVRNWLRTYGMTIAGYILGIALLANSALVFYLLMVHKTSEDERFVAKWPEQYLQQLRPEAVHADVLAREVMLWNDDRTIRKYESVVGGLEKAFDSVTYNLRTRGFDETLMGRMEVTVTDVLKNHRHFLNYFLSPDSTAVRPNLATLSSAFDAVHRDIALV